MDEIQTLPASHGTYVLSLFVARPQPITIGRLGQFNLPAAHYFYVGSARGAGGLRARVGRHVRGDGTQRWHIDYLRVVAEVREIFYTVADGPLECAWSQALIHLPHAVIPVPHFGSSDCRSGCAAHLVGFSRRADIDHVPHVLAQITPTPIDLLRPR